ncbi:hypothetical protein BD626DRAFT_571267 [Schizophyllum amplum]|uniref:Uncharacterized protein n=1 Tax=Schizophyllum amplum TaxID=97359 RepID=A0A550C7Y0_9AGAR|nr:hypothetical protein BD626DRAFT_571267 [Auriculariopsis ampla]
MAYIFAQKAKRNYSAQQGHGPREIAALRVLVKDYRHCDVLEVADRVLKDFPYIFLLFYGFDDADLSQSAVTANS